MTRVPFNPKTPIESFDPRFRNIWLRAALEPIVISFDSPRDAAAFQARLQNFRANLKKANDPLASAMYRARTSRTAAVLTISPSDLKFNSILSQFDSPSNTFVSPAEPETDIPVAKEINFDELFAEFPLEASSEI